MASPLNCGYLNNTSLVVLWHLVVLYASYVFSLNWCLLYVSVSLKGTLSGVQTVPLHLPQCWHSKYLLGHINWGVYTQLVLCVEFIEEPGEN